jgi:sugar lactone lactonase YvrE
MSTPKHFLATQNRLGETPIWSPNENALYWVDWGGLPTCRYDFDKGELTTFSVGLPVTSIARRSTGGGWLAISKNAIYDWNPKDNSYNEVFGLPEPEKPEIGYNDCAVDRQGRLLFGTVDNNDPNAPTSSLYQLDKDFTLKKLDTGYASTNGIGVSPDGKTVYVTDMQNRQIIALDYDSDEARTFNRRRFATIPENEGLPDGLIVDAEGFVWGGHWGGWKLTRYDPSGNVDRKFSFPVEHVISCAFCGPELDQLIVTTSWYAFDDEKRKAQPFAGDLFLIDIGVRGLVEPAFEG